RKTSAIPPCPSSAKSRYLPNDASPMRPGSDRTCSCWSLLNIHAVLSRVLLVVAHLREGAIVRGGRGLLQVLGRAARQVRPGRWEDLPGQARLVLRDSSMSVAALSRSLQELACLHVPAVERAPVGRRLLPELRL